MSIVIPTASRIVRTAIGICSISLVLSAPVSADPLNECVDGWLDYWEELFGETSTPDDVGIAKGKCCKNKPALCSSPGSSDPGYGITLPGLVNAKNRMVARKLANIREKRLDAKELQDIFENTSRY